MSETTPEIEAPEPSHKHHKKMTSKERKVAASIRRIQAGLAAKEAELTPPRTKNKNLS